jgi:uncharacterized membrane protein (DUF373 family)
MSTDVAHATLRKYLELTQDVIVVGLCLMLFAGMGIKLFHLGQAIIRGVDFSLVVGDILFILVLLEVFRLLVIYLEEHRVSVATMVEVGIVSTLREIILIGPLHVNWVLLLVICAFLVTLGILLRYAGIRLTSVHPPAQRDEQGGRLWQPECRSTFRES